MMCNNPNLDLVSINAYAKFGQILSICSQDIDQKQNYDGWIDGQHKPIKALLFQSRAIILSDDTQKNMEILACDPWKYIMDHPNFLVISCMKYSICIGRTNMLSRHAG